jgi:hypothetical protein
MLRGLLQAVFAEEETERVVGQPSRGEAWIETPGGKTIYLLGTDIYVKVDPRDKSTLVAVVEGHAEIEWGTGARVRLGPGEWTHIPIDGPPAPPRPIPPVDGVAPPGFPGELLPVDPPWLDSLRFDLPR